MQISGIILGILRTNVYTIEEVIIPDQSSVIPPKQKYICSNKTIVKMEKGEYFNNELIYQNLAKKYGRDYKYDLSFNELIQTTSNYFTYYLKGHKIPYTLLGQNISRLQNTNLLVYKEIGDLFNEVYRFLIQKKEIDMNQLKHLSLYYDYLPSTIQYILNYTFALYHYHYHYDLSYMKKIEDLNFYYALKTNEVSESITPLSAVYLKNEYVPIPPFHYNEWMDASIYADLGFICTLNQQYSLAYEFFQKAKAVHPVIIAKYLPAYYMCILSTQPSLLRFVQYLNQLSSDFQSHIQFFNFLLNKDRSIKRMIDYKILPRLYKSDYSSFTCFNLKFLNLIKEKGL